MSRQHLVRIVKHRADAVGPEPSSDVGAEYKEMETLGLKLSLKESGDLNMVAIENICGPRSTGQKIRL